MSGLVLGNAIVCTLMALRLLCFRRKGSSWRPRAALLAYILVLASASAPIRWLLGASADVTVSQLTLNIVLCLAVFAVGGNVSELFRQSGDGQSVISRALRWQRWF